MTAFPEPNRFPEGASLTDGVWTQIFTPRAQTQSRPALFLDRDGVVVEEAHYLHKVEDVQLTPNAADVIKTANAKNIPVVLVTNQAGIGYRMFEWDDFVNVQERIMVDLAEGGAHLDGVFACPFSAKGQDIYFHEDHPARKPNAGMLNFARDLMGIELSKSWIVGDRDLDLLAGKNAGCAGGVHVLTGHGNKDGARESALAVGDETFQALSAQNLSEAKELLKVLA
ncbi:HAD-IIIA family hydrolase [Magnetovibrio sp. PR-2]|uniref:D-glycero-alpha-D-manno-heptose-1,7-bisphosphate 7-phosphatase n=1 Tax=Magnetovibrio sp. PR-2 TaxID=3120356 RepID=UPI002FCDF37F